MGMTIEQAKKLDQFLCSECSFDDDVKRSQNSFPVSPHAEPKVRMLINIYFVFICDLIGLCLCCSLCPRLFLDTLV